MAINQLIILAGSAGVGKSTLMDRIRAEKEPAIAAQLGLEDVSQWEFLTAKEHLRKRHIPRDKVVLHFDLTGAFSFLTREYSFVEDKAIDFLDQVRSISVLTLWSMPEICIARVKRRRRQLKINLLRRAFMPREIVSIRNRLKRLARICDLYENPSLLIQRYEEWFEYLMQFPIDRHWLCAPGEATDRLSPPSDWRRVARLLMSDRGHPPA